MIKLKKLIIKFSLLTFAFAFLDQYAFSQIQMGENCNSHFTIPVPSGECAYVLYSTTGYADDMIGCFPLPSTDGSVEITANQEEEVVIEINNTSSHIIRVNVLKSDCTVQQGCISVNPGLETSISIPNLIEGEKYVITFDFIDSSTGSFQMCVHSPQALPIELIKFNAIASLSKVYLLWQTAAEINNAGFELQKSKDTKSWKTIAWVEGKSNFAGLTEYEQVDKSPYSDLNYYRLKQVDYNGRFEYSSIISINYESFAQFEIIVFPNPASEKITIQTYSNSNFEIKVFDVLGRIIYSKMDATPLVEMDVSAWDKGWYIFDFSNGQKKIQTWFLKK